MRRILNNAISLIVVVIVLFLVIPLHPSVLDVLLILNISLSIMILMITMNISEPLEFSIFPSLLLITTLFRLGLNVSSTRLILKNGGNAGVVIKAFGDLITQGNIVIGILIFLIIVLVQFIVITKGAERVSEVAARFTLDAMPGKQMAIDADLSSGLINEKEARLRRQKIQREADFYGAMDGATKIVKGDAVMSLIITVINFVAGLIIGIVQGGGDLSTVLSVYSIATIGDGLVSQLPALIISTATGMIVTRSVSDGSLNTEVPPGGGARKYRTCDTIQRYSDHVERKAQEIGEGGRLAELNLKKLEAEVALKESQGSLHRLKTAIAEGKYLPAEQATEELAEFMTAFQKFAMTIPARMAGAMSGYADAITIRNAQKAIRKELETMLTAYVDAMQVEDTPGAEP